MKSAQLMCAADRAERRANMSRSLVKHNQSKRSKDAANTMESGNAAEVEMLSWQLCLDVSIS